MNFIEKAPWKLCSLTYLVLALPIGAADPKDLFTYDKKLPFDIREAGVEERNGVKIHDISYANLTGGRTDAFLVAPPGSAKGPGILFVHWLGESESDRRQFRNEAVAMAKKGAHSLLINAMWSAPEWFPKRKRSEDYANSLKQVRELRRALDLLESRPGVDRQRIVYVGHDFGAMYGTLLAAVEPRIRAWALQTPTGSFTDWYLYGPKMPEPDRTKFVEQMAPLDPVRYIALAAPRPVLLQFAKTDRYVPVAKAQAYYDAAKEPKKILWYEAGHALDERAMKDRVEWVSAQLGLR